MVCAQAAPDTAPSRVVPRMASPWSRSPGPPPRDRMISMPGLCGTGWQQGRKWMPTRQHWANNRNGHPGFPSAARRRPHGRETVTERARFLARVQFGLWGPRAVRNFRRDRRIMENWGLCSGNILCNQECPCVNLLRLASIETRRLFLSALAYAFPRLASGCGAEHRLFRKSISKAAD